MLKSEIPRFHGYRVERLLGRGGMADVWLATQLSLKRKVAVKLLSGALGNHARALNLFERESVIIAGLNHPNIIHVIDRGVSEDSRPFFIMEYVEAETLADMVRQGRLSTERRLDVLIQICRAVGYAHRNGVIHRDLKPANVLIDNDGNARLLDFGIAQLLSRARQDLLLRVGTPDYMAPEQRSGDGEIGPACDLWALGVTMHLLLAGRLPNPNRRSVKRYDPSLPASLDKIIAKCLEKDPLQRPATADEVRDVLLRALGGRHLSGHVRERATDQAKRPKYQLLDVIRETEFSSVYLFEDARHGELLVIKRIHQSQAGLRESRVLMALHHRHILSPRAAEARAKGMVLVMPALAGGSLQQRMASPWPLEDFFPVAKAITAGMAFAHRNRVWHGNLRPSNVLFDDDDNVRLADFGLEEHYQDAEVANWYRPPGGETLSPAIDQYSVGAIFYHLLCGHPVAHREGEDPMSDARLASIPEPLHKTLEMMISPFAGDRPRDFEIVLSMLEEADKLAGTATAEWENTDLRGASPRVRRGRRQAQSKGLPWMTILPWMILLTAVATLLAERFIPSAWKQWLLGG
jgi:serine/threonine-protein kinase